MRQSRAEKSGSCPAGARTDRPSAVLVPRHPRGVASATVNIAPTGEIDPGGDLTDLREQNLRRVLAVLLANREGLTQPEVVERTGLSRTTVSSLVGSLERVVVAEPVRKRSDRGRPLMAWHVDPSAACSIGIDIGRTHVAVAATNSFGEIFCGPLTEPVAGVLERPHHVLAAVADLLEELIDGDGLAHKDIAAVTVGLPGPVGVSTGVMEDPATPAWAGIDAREEIRKRWPHPSVPALLADNDANLGAIAEHRLGAGRDAQSLLFIKWSSGIGGGLILNGSSWRGSSGVAGEIGHLPVQPSEQEAAVLGLPADRDGWPLCERCSRPNCLEQLAGGQTVAGAAGLPDLEAVILAGLDKSAGPEAERAAQVLKTAAGLIGRAVGPTLTLLDVERVIIGGVAGQPALYPLLVEDFANGLAATATGKALRDASLEVGALGRDAPVLGAAIAGLDGFGVSFLLAMADGPHERDHERPAGPLALAP